MAVPGLRQEVSTLGALGSDRVGLASERRFAFFLFM